MIHVGNCLDILPTLEAESVQTCITSPPYFGLRDYGVDGQLGLEATPAEFVSAMVAVFREVRRVLRDDGTLWLNLGDSYAGSGRGGMSGGGASTLQGGRDSQAQAPRSDREVSSAQRMHCPAVRGSRLPAGLHESQRQAGAIGRAWVPPPAGLKQKDLIGIPWRVAFALQEDGWYLRQDIIWHKPNPMPESVRDRCTKAHEYLFLLSKSPRYYFEADAIAEPVAESSVSRLAQPTLAQQAGSSRVPGKTNGNMKAVGGSETRNKRSVWSVPTVPFKEAHFATFPEKLIEPCVLGGSRPGDLVLDPFLGAGTTAVVAQRLARRWIGCELNPHYAEIARERLAGTSTGFPFGDAA
ncbi:DNA-methyltransferase [Coralloluteibacterium thermophilus]|uniref:Methyltransferase n=1 Tax=Coralloluteibacterium thermophilum TaxID=2707049 RepID=A0ABV9NFG4_9GAMM